MYMEHQIITHHHYPPSIIILKAFAHDEFQSAVQREWNDFKEYVFKGISAETKNILSVSIKETPPLHK